MISTKAGYDMWPGPYGQGGGSRKYVLASLDQSLERMGLDYVDIFYSHRFDPETPVEETMMALDTAVRSGRALYAGISSYSAAKTQRGGTIARELGTPLLIHQPSYSMLNRWIEGDLLDELEEQGMGCIVFTALAQGLLTDRYLDGVPADSRAARDDSTVAGLDDDVLARPCAQRDRQAARPEAGPARAAVGAARPAGHLGGDRCLVSVEQLDTNLDALDGPPLTDDELAAIDRTPWSPASTCGRSGPRNERAERTSALVDARSGASAHMSPGRRVVVVGADAAGMGAAHQALRTAARRGEALSVTALEASGHTSYSACGIPYWMAGERREWRRPRGPHGRGAPEGRERGNSTPRVVAADLKSPRG